MMATGERTLIAVVVILFVIFVVLPAVWAEAGSFMTEAEFNLLIGNR